MNRVLVCTGEYATSPYYFDKVYVNVYSIEELCYVMAENAFLLDKDILDKKLVEWIDTECKLSDLASELYKMVTHSVEVSSFVGCILEYVGYYSKAEIDKIESILRMNVSMNAYEKWKAKADFLYENRHFLLAIAEYEKLLFEIPEAEITLKSHVYNDIGVAYMALYLYDSAAESFMKAYELDNNELALRHYLTVKRLSLSDEEYIRVASESEEAYKLSLLIESDLENARRAYEETEEKTRLTELFALKNDAASAIYYEEIGRITDRLKEDYRDIVLDSERADINTETIM